jgi:hypothetical protein
MPKAIVTKPFLGAPDGEIHPRRFVKGDCVEGKLAEVALAEKWAEPAKPETPKPQPQGQQQGQQQSGQR